MNSLKRWLLAVCCCDVLAVRARLVSLWLYRFLTFSRCPRYGATRTHCSFYSQSTVMYILVVTITQLSKFIILDSIASDIKKVGKG